MVVYFTYCVELKLWNMKAMIYLLAGTLFTSFTNKTYDENIDGIWMGYYRSDILKEKVIVKFNESDKMEFYTGGVDDRTRLEGSYHILGDSVSITYKDSAGEEITMQGHFNRRKNFVDGSWKGKEKSSGSFYLEKQQVEELYARP